MQNKEAVIHTINETTKKDAMEILFSYLDKGIDDMESGRVHTADEAFKTWFLFQAVLCLQSVF